MKRNIEYAKLRENIHVINGLSELSMDNSYKQVEYNTNSFKVILQFPKKETNKRDIEFLKKEIHSILSGELQEQIKRIS